jgi:hypothetical protein
MSSGQRWLGFLMILSSAVLISKPSRCLAGVGSSGLSSMPIREVTIFKDGHAFVLHSGDVPTDENGDVLLDYLPTPIIGTFWPFENDPQAELKGVSAGQQRIELEKTALSIRDLLAANVGARIEVREEDKTYRAQIVGIPQASSEELESTAPAGSGLRLPQPGNLILLRTEVGTRAIGIDRIQDVTFIDQPSSQLKHEEIRNLLKLRLDWKGRQPAKTARIGMTYLQKGLRWIPSYKLKLNGDGTIHVQLQGTILNELADLDNVTANLLIGVPSFDFKSTIDPIALRDTMAQLSPYFHQESQTAHAFSNSLMLQTQSARMGEYRHGEPQASTDLGPEVSVSGQNEEVFVFTAKNLTLKRGERLVMTVGEWTMPYQDVFRVDLPFAPPMEVRQNFNATQEAELAKLFHAPKVKHLLRIVNNQAVPMTTAPALIVSDKGVLGQGMMTYTSPGATVDLTVTTAINVPVSYEEEEIKRAPDALTWRNHTFMKIDMQGIVRLSNYRSEEIDVEVVRTVMGSVNTAEADGKLRRPGAWSAELLTHRPAWWGWYSWPYWWTHMNSINRIEWKHKLAAGKTLELPYTWHYYWTY